MKLADSIQAVEPESSGRSKLEFDSELVLQIPRMFLLVLSTVDQSFGVVVVGRNLMTRGEASYS